MDESVFNLDEPLDIESTANSSKDRSDSSARFIDALHAARRKQASKPQPPVQLCLSKAARNRVRERGDEAPPRQGKGDSPYPRPRKHSNKRSDDAQERPPKERDKHHG